MARKDWSSHIISPPKSDEERIMLLLSYNGSSYSGWQKQKNEITVQSVLEEVLKKIAKNEVSISASGRTDSGVHSLGQVAHFDIKKNTLEPSKYRDFFNFHLPKDIRVLKSKKAKNNFHSRYSSLARSYIYKVVEEEYALPFDYGTSWIVRKKIDLKKLNNVSKLLEGENDFTAFSSSRDLSKSKLRDLYRAKFKKVSLGHYEFEIIANAFLYNQVRLIVGTFINNCEKDNLFEIIKNLLLTKSKDTSVFCAPPYGLYFNKVVYNEKEWKKLSSKIEGLK